MASLIPIANAFWITGAESFYKLSESDPETRMKKMSADKTERTGRPA
jgi:hypothetical protein